MRWMQPLLSVLVSLLVTWPMAIHPFSMAIGSQDGDGPKHVWNLWWMRREFWTGPLGLSTQLVNWPGGMELYPIEPLNGLFTALLPLPPIFLSNLLAFAHITLLGICTGWLGRLVSGTRRGGIIAGILAQGSAFTAFTLHAGVGELRQVWWIPLGLCLAIRMREACLESRPEWWKWSLGLAAVLAGAVLSCFYHGFFLATALSTWALVTLRPNAKLLAAYALAAGLSAGTSIPVIKTFSATYGTDTRPNTSFSAWMDDWGGHMETYKNAALDPQDFLFPRTKARRPVDRQMFAYTGGRYIGISVLLLSFLGILAAPRKAGPWVMVSLVGLILSLGTVPWWSGEQLTLNGQRVLLPLAWINRALAYFAEPLNFPARFLSVTTIGFAVLGGLAGRWKWTPYLVPIAILDVLAGDLVPFPRSMLTIPDMSGLEAGEGAVLDASMILKAAQSNPGDSSVIAGIDPETRLRAMAAQIELGRPIQGMPIERIDHWATDGMAWARALPLSGAMTAGRLDPSHNYQEDLWLLRARGFDRILITHDATNGPPPQAAGILNQLCTKASRAPYGSLWIIPEVTASESDQNKWIDEQNTRASKVGVPMLGEQYPER